MNKLSKSIQNLFHPKFESGKALKKYKLKALIFLAVSVTLTILSSILTSLVDNIIVSICFIPVMPICIILLLISIIMLIKAHNEKYRLNRVTCTKCGTRYRFPEDVKYELAHIYSRSKQNNDTIKKETYQQVYYNCTCNNCGKQSSFNHPVLIKEETLNLLGAVLNSYDFDAEFGVMDFFRDEQQQNSANN